MEESICVSRLDVETKRGNEERGSKAEGRGGEENQGEHRRKSGEVRSGGEEREDVAEVGDRESDRMSIEDGNRDANRDVNNANNDAVRGSKNMNNDAVRGTNMNNDAFRGANRADNDAIRDANVNNDAYRDAVGSSISVLYTNAQSLVNKINEMRAIVAINDPDIVIITETWSNESISNEYLSINGYDIIKRRDRNDTDKGRGGGILMYVKKSLYS